MVGSVSGVRLLRVARQWFASRYVPGRGCAEILGAVVFLILTQDPRPATAQDLRCSSAVAQLQGYATRVNAIANFESTQGVFARCGYNQFCQQQWLYQLNGWYMQQANHVNAWYSQIVQACSAPPDRGGRGRGRVPGRAPSGDGPGQIDEGAIDDIEIDREDKSVRIRIPSNPQGFRAR